MIRLAPLALTLALAGCAGSGAGPRSAGPDLYVLVGQSNMSGFGRLDALTSDERVADPAIRLYANDGTWKPALDPLDAATGQVDPVSADPSAGVGPGLFFARDMRRTGARAIDLVPCAKGGSAIARWAPAPGRDTLYGSCRARIAEAGGRPAGILWYQGEADTRTPELAASWAGRFAAMVAAFRRDFNAPRLPVVVVELSDRDPRPEGATRYPGWATVQAAQRALKIPCVATVTATGLPKNPDRLHVATEGYRVLGPRIAAAMRKLRATGCR